ncbi:MAG: ABC transporter permease [Deltaproteobacteria bacterium]|nr:MAG: ABC transporter permease [Deltaproteobacteria bacterium]
MEELKSWEKRKGTARVLFQFFKENPLALAGAVVILLSVLVSILAPLLPIQDPLSQNLANRYQPPNAQNLFGTDDFGRDVLSRVIWGGRVSLLVGILSTLIGAVIGVFMGIVAGYFGKIVDSVIMRVSDVLLSFPALLLALAICAALGSSLWNVTIAIAIVTIPRFSTLVRGTTLSVKETDFVEAARALGQNSAKILWFHIFPNVLSPIIVLTTLWIPAAIITEAALSFLGLGVMPPTPTWGNIISDGKSYLENAPWISLFGGGVTVLVVMAFNFVGDAARDALDPRLKGEREVRRG